MLNEQQTIQALSALAHPLRLQAYRALVVAGPHGRTPGDLCQQLGAGAPTLSFHLKELMHADLVDVERHGRNLIYRVRLPTMQGLLAYLTENCCEGASCDFAPPPPCASAAAETP